MRHNQTLSRRQRERADREKAILAAAREVFFQEGIHHATVDAIAAKAEVAKGTVYLYFPSKETLLAHLVLEGLDSIYSRLERAYDEGAAHSAETRLRRLATAYFDFYVEEPDYFRLLMAFDRGHFRESIGAELYQTILHRSLAGLHWLVRVIEQGIAARELAPGDPRRLAGATWAALNGVLVLTSHPLRREILAQDVRALYDEVMEILLRGMKNNGK
ncbi:MAG: TetR/AcrR family transcriptional regulator [Anaerolineales bacterium]|nr:TetR/AcrR family transcriptional regulator [Anaerolineales bacterium]